MSPAPRFDQVSLATGSPPLKAHRGQLWELPLTAQRTPLNSDAASEGKILVMGFLETDLLIRRVGCLETREQTVSGDPHCYTAV